MKTKHSPGPARYRPWPSCPSSSCCFHARSQVSPIKTVYLNPNKQKLLWGTSEKTVLLPPYFVCNAATTPDNQKLGGGTSLFEPQSTEITSGNQLKGHPVCIHSYPYISYISILWELAEMLFFKVNLSFPYLVFQKRPRPQSRVLKWGQNMCKSFENI